MRQIQLTQIKRPQIQNTTASAAAIPIDRFIQSHSIQPSQPNEPPDWHTCLVNCCSSKDNCAFCLLATVCPCIAYGMNYSLLVGEHSSDPRFCCCPCLLFAALETSGIFIAAANSALETLLVLAKAKKGAFIHGNTGPNLSGIAESCMLYHHRYAVGRKAGVYPSDNTCTHCTICCEVTWCAPCAQSQLRSEVIHQRIRNQGFVFKPQPNPGCCKILCCKHNCGCTGCIDTE